MKLSLEQNNDLPSTTSEEINYSQIKENHLFNHIGKLAAGHDIIVSNTMIKITYKKALKDQNTVEHTVNCNTHFNCSQNKSFETPNLCNTNISFIVKSPKVTAEQNKALMLHFAPNIAVDKKKKYANGLNLSAKVNHSAGKNCSTKLQKSQERSPSRSKKTNSSKQLKSDTRILKTDDLLKPEGCIIQSSNGDAKKETKLSKFSDKKNIKNLENELKKKAGIEKESKKIGTVKRKAQITGELNWSPKHKRLKLNETKQKESKDVQYSEVIRSPSKKQIMLVDPDLPVGWTRFIRTKNKGSANEEHVVYIVNPQGKKFRFKWKLRKYLLRTNSPLDASQFFFGLYQRPRTSNISPTDETEGGRSKKRVGDMTSTRASLGDIQSSPEDRSDNSGNSRHTNPQESSNDPSKSSDGREILFFDPDLPFGWKRLIHSSSRSGRKQVHIISPDGKIFRRRYRLSEYLTKHQYTHNLDRFYFGLYVKKEGSSSENFDRKNSDSGKSSYQMENTKMRGTAMTDDRNSVSSQESSKMKIPNSPMHYDPLLPEGWKRFIKIRSCGESAGRMEVVIVSPDGRKHRSRKHLEHYLKQKELNYKAGDFDFTVYGRANLKKRFPSSSASAKQEEVEPDGEPESQPELCDVTCLRMKKKFTDKPVPELDINSLKETVTTPEGHLINTVNGLLMCSGLSSARSIRRRRLPRKEHEKVLKSYFGSEKDFSWDECHIPTHWVQRLVKCSGDFRNLEPDAAATIAETTKKFIKKMSIEAFASSDQPESGLTYEDLAEFVDRKQDLSFLKTLIPKKITFRKYRELNRPKQFLSFT